MNKPSQITERYEEAQAQAYKEATQDLVDFFDCLSKEDQLRLLNELKLRTKTK